jgi:hypothetical protein
LRTSKLLPAPLPLAPLVAAAFSAVPLSTCALLPSLAGARGAG